MSSKSFFGFKYGGSKKASIPKTAPPIQPSPVVFQPNADEMRRVFDKFDKNKDGKISKEEYVSAVDMLGSKTAKTEVLKAFEAIDTDGDGFVDFNKFMAAQGGVKAGDIKSAFKVFDLDGNGKITAEELVQVLRQLGERCSLEACRKMVRGADANGDGMIDVDEFVGLMTRTMKCTQ